MPRLTRERRNALQLLLGTMLDHELADRFGVATSTICYHRTQAHIAPMEKGALALWRDRLGTMPDAAIAREASTSRSAVTSLRHRLKIPPYRTPKQIEVLQAARAEVARLQEANAELNREVLQLRSMLTPPYDWLTPSGDGVWRARSCRLCHRQSTYTRNAKVTHAADCPGILYDNLIAKETP